VNEQRYINLDVCPNGEQFVTTSFDELVKFTDAGLGYLVWLDVDIGNSNSDIKIVAHNNAELPQKLDSVILVTNNGKSVYFNLVGSFNFKNSHIKTLNEILKLKADGKEIYTLQLVPKLQTRCILSFCYFCSCIKNVLL
jgi:hypothetical protein